MNKTIKIVDTLACPNPNKKLFIPPYKSLIELEISKKDFSKNYTLHSKIGIYITCLIGLLRIEWLKD